MIDYYINKLQSELARAEEKHPIWPTDAVHASAILNEEAGELTQAALDFHDGKTDSIERMKEEAIQVGAMALRFLKNLDGYQKNAMRAGLLSPYFLCGLGGNMSKPEHELDQIISDNLIRLCKHGFNKEA